AQTESYDVAETILDHRKKNRTKWSDYAVLYRVHSHRTELVKELVERNVPFTIENMNVMDSTEARDLFACFGAVVSPSDGVSLFRIAALPQFSVNPDALQAAMKAAASQSPNRTADIQTVLSEVPGGQEVLDRVRSVRATIPTDMNATEAIEMVIRGFQLDRSAPPIASVVTFVQGWQLKAITEKGDLAELLDYLYYFRQAGGCISLKEEGGDAIYLGTAHGAKGLEFPHVFILRAKSSCFPTGYKEPLIAFPRELRDQDSVAEEDDKELHGQEERRLFYVAMTRARDTLHLLAPKTNKKGKPESVPARYLQDLAGDKSVARYVGRRPPLQFQTEIAAFAQVNSSRVSEWLSKEPSADLARRLSVTAIEAYDRCPLQFKLQREWPLPREVPGALHYGSAMHLVLRAYFDALGAGRPMPDDTVIELFSTTLANAGISDDYQYELYEKQGIEQLREFLEIQRTSPPPDVLHTEQGFELKVGITTVAGRIDRIDRLPNGHVAIMDYKTGRPRKERDAEKSLQLSVYALAALRQWGYEADEVAFYNMEGNNRLADTRTDKQLEGALKKIEETAENISAGEFTADPGFVCDYCPYHLICPATEHRVTPIGRDGKKKQN
ncbi:MAG: ATP-dependent helicase, partial [Acidobacteriales bacterium]|nr:ATP-dependent helicase [Terriglobales bacterium]